jgi:multidrug resistance efflux pump
LKPFKKFNQGELILQIDDTSIQKSIINYKDQLKLIDKEQIILSIQLILVENHNWLETAKLTNEIAKSSYQLLNNYASQWVKLKENKDAQIKSLEKQIDEIRNSISIQTSNIENLENILEQSEKLFKEKYIRLKELDNDRQNLANAQLQYSDFKNQITDLKNQQQVIGSDYLNKKLSEKVQLQNTKNNLDLKILEINQLLAKNQEELKKYKVYSPIEGVINDSISLTEGSVVSVNQIIAEIASNKKKTIVKAYLPSTQREIMKRLMPARISIINLNQNLPEIYDGFVSQISPNVISNINEPFIDPTNEYYLLEIQSENINEKNYNSGQPVEVYITLLEQSVLSYLISPVRVLLSNTFNE